MSNNFDGVGVEMFIRNGFGGCVEDGRNIVFGLNMGWNCGRIWYNGGALLNVSFEDLRTSRGT